MISKTGENKFYKTIYLLTFGRESHFFYTNDSLTIITYLKENFWGEDLRIKLNLLIKLLYFDSYTNPQMSRDLKMKSTELSECIIRTQE